MATCAACKFEIADSETIVQAAACGHDCHEYCVPQVDDGSTPCYECNPELWVEEEVTDTATDSSVVAADTEVEPYVDPVAETPVDSGVDPSTAVPDATATSTTSDTEIATAAADAPTIDLDAAQVGAAVSLRSAIDRATAAATAAESTLEELTGAGATRAAVFSAVDGDVAGWSAALAYCTSTPSAWAPYADGAATWLASQETIDDMNGGIAGLDSQSAILETGQPVLAGVTVVDLGDGVFDTLSATGERNVAEMAVGGPGWTGHNLHALTRELVGWSSIRAEEGFVVIVRWAGEKLQVGATGKHKQRGQSGDDYALDGGKVATTFAAGLAWKGTSGTHTLVEAGA